MATSLQDIVAPLAISNPLRAVPVFLALTERTTPAERTRAGLRAAIAATIIWVVALVGRRVLAAFGISMPALQAAGGLVILLMGPESSTARRPKCSTTTEDGNRRPTEYWFRSQCRSWLAPAPLRRS
ncbi:MAG: hypothetical protein GEU82_11220 [Luteitalea sp.]|nr:hypothetical protein [Luteitalea sp.]